MLRRSLRHALLAALACAALLTASAIARPSATPTVTLYAAGDIATCHGQSDEQTAKLLKSTNGPIAALGDLVYPDGTEEDFRNCFDPSWGPLVPRIKAVPKFVRETLAAVSVVTRPVADAIVMVELP